MCVVLYLSILLKLRFLEHMESGVHYFESTWLNEDDFDTYLTEGIRLQKKYKDSICVFPGVEVGYNPSHKQELLNLLQQRSWNSIGVSYHFMVHLHGGEQLNLSSQESVNIAANVHQNRRKFICYQVSFKQTSHIQTTTSSNAADIFYTFELGRKEELTD